ncbi:hypothetical protein SO802_014036 [Lithocarpus litseifolius]|uniref:Leucine-rich repeat-containing N-terminal plant-type domain-containing protein n=1 Tax=Lithocarpus litseifolius TaxID=425828 RepID=A0AAW2DB76_9ROSI
MLMRLLCILPLFYQIHSSPSMHPSCHDDERSALLQFKQSFTIEESASSFPIACNRVRSWTPEGENSTDCCSWHGVDCDEDTGHVIGLDLSNSCLLGSINSNSTLFHLVHLQKLNLADNYFNYSQIPSQVGNLSRLTHLNLAHSMLSGQIPLEVSKLSQLSSLGLGWNQDSKKNLLRLGRVNISSTVPNSFANMSNLRSLYLLECGMYGEFPKGIFMLPNLRILDVNHNEDLNGSWPDFQYWRSPLEQISLARVNFSSELPSSMGNLSSLIALQMPSCSLSGSIPSSIGNLTNLIYLDLSNNILVGNIPSSIGNLIQLVLLSLHNNHLTGLIPSRLANLTQLIILDMSYNQLTGKIPLGLRKLTLLNELGLASNEFEGRFPIFIFNLRNLNFLDISDNYLSGIKWICNMTFLHVLDVSNNNFKGSLPECLHNVFYGSKLRMISLRGNKFQGLLPRSLANCTMLEAFDVSNNQFSDTFPSWLENLPNLKILILRSNQFYGKILESPETNYEFPNLRILDLSYNIFSGNLPLNSFRNWNALKLDKKDHPLTYVHEKQYFNVGTHHLYYYYDYSMKITNKGVDTVYKKVQDFLRAIDMSSNRFVGEIPKSIGDLKDLNMLNLSNNILTGHIPVSLENLTQLESLDLSQNRLSGEIPPQLTQLTFLEWFNVSHNYLTGSIPEGKQFNTFETSSFEGNLGLCGNPLSKKCWDFDSSPAAFDQTLDSPGFHFEFGWKILLIGYGFGFVVGVIIGNIAKTRKDDWLKKAFEMTQSTTITIMELEKGTYRN